LEEHFRRFILYGNNGSRVKKVTFFLYLGIE